MIRANTCNYERWCEIMIQEKLRRSEKKLLWHGIMYDSIVHYNDRKNTFSHKKLALKMNVVVIITDYNYSFFFLFFVTMHQRIIITYSHSHFSFVSILLLVSSFFFFLFLYFYFKLKLLLLSRNQPQIRFNYIENVVSFIYFYHWQLRLRW